MSLTNQIHIYSVDTSFFYNENEQKTHSRMNSMFILRSYDKKEIEKIEKKKNKTEEDITNLNKLKQRVRFLNKFIKNSKDLLYIKLSKNRKTRTMDNEKLKDRNIISVFESTLTRTIEAKINKLNKDIIVVQTYFFQVLEDIIKNGFIWNNEKYICFTASAGQIRTKKTVFIKESVWNKYKLSLMCGLTFDSINEQGGMNINKFLAYLALCNSATSHWSDFDIDKSIVVNDLETEVKSDVDFICDKTYEITRENKSIPIEHTDGAGMILPSLSKKNFMCRVPFVKGLLVSTPYDKFIREERRKSRNKDVGKIKDIYGKEYDILEDDIQIIFTKSQFKMWKYYKSWDEYKGYFKKYNCQAGKTNIEEDTFNTAKLNYQMLQTLVDITEEELQYLSRGAIEDIQNLGSDRVTMLKTMGVIEANKNKNYYQQALEIYPELLGDTYSREILKQVKKSLVKNGRAGKFDINGVYTFICPDMYAFCEFLFKGDTNPKGLLDNGEVYCNIYPKSKKLDCLRSPHLYREHAIRKNVIDKEKKKWFTTNGLYTSIHDPISKLLMFDVDGDMSLVCADEKLIEIAERNMEDIVPLFYNMAKANEEEVNMKNIYKGLTLAYSGGNIGQISNEITKIWNSDDINMEAIKILCMESNFVIDYAKTLYKPERPKEKNSLIQKYTKNKTPWFFTYAKDKLKKSVEPVNNSTVNKLEKIIPNPRISFKKAQVGEFNSKMLMNNTDIEIDYSIVKKYTELDLNKRFMSSEDMESVNSMDGLYVYKEIRSELLKINSDVVYVTDVLIKYLYEEKNSNFKTTLWSSFGDIIVENLLLNIEREFKDAVPCENCGCRMEVSNNKQKYCGRCAKEINNKKTREAMKSRRNKEKCLK